MHIYTHISQDILYISLPEMYALHGIANALRLTYINIMVILSKFIESMYIVYNIPTLYILIAN